VESWQDPGCDNRCCTFCQAQLNGLHLNQTGTGARVSHMGPGSGTRDLKWNGSVGLSSLGDGLDEVCTNRWLSYRGRVC
jgi:hypothetical protein